MSRMDGKKTHTHVVFGWFCFGMYYNVFVKKKKWCPCMAIDVSVQYNGGLLADIILLAQCYDHRGTWLNAMKRFCIYSL